MFNNTKCSELSSTLTGWKSMEKHGKKSCHGKSWTSHRKWAKKIKSWKFKKVVEKSWKSHGISPLLTENLACEIPIIPYIKTFSLCSKLQIVMLDKSKLKSFLLQWTTSLDSSSGSLFVRMCWCPRHVGHNYVPLFGVAQLNVDLRYYIIRDVIVI